MKLWSSPHPAGGHHEETHFTGEETEAQSEPLNSGNKLWAGAQSLQTSILRAGHDKVRGQLGKRNPRRKMMPAANGLTLEKGLARREEEAEESGRQSAQVSGEGGWSGGGDAGRECWKGRRRGRVWLGPVALTQDSDGSVFWGRRVGGVTCAELVGRGGAGAGTPGPQSGWKAWGMGSRLRPGYWAEVGVGVEGMRLNPG